MSRIVFASSIITTQPSRIACTNAESTRRTLPASSAAGTNSWRKRYSSDDGPPVISTNP
jgi:hypothetical protein